MARGRPASVARSDNASAHGAASLEYIDEKLVLRPVVVDADPDGYPCFELRDAIVYSRNGKRMANLLVAELEGPFTIQGTLRLNKTHKALRMYTPMA